MVDYMRQYDLADRPSYRYHWHRCDCTFTFGHHKNFIDPEHAAAAHECPKCGRPVNERLDEPPAHVDLENYYGPGQVAKLIEPRIQPEPVKE